VTNHRVLVLNKLWQPVNVCSVKRAICLLCAERAQVVCVNGDQVETYTFDDWVSLGPVGGNGDVVRSVSFAFRAPRVVALLHYDRFPVQRVRFSRKNVLARDGYVCQYCGRSFPVSELNVDHVIPLSQGGETTWENVVCSCKRCNAQKGGRVPHAAGMKLRRKPIKPHWRPHLLAGGRVDHESWRPFLATAKRHP